VAQDSVKTDAADASAARGHDVFISYSRADRDAVVALTRALEERGKRAWVDLEDIPPSAEWMAEIRSAIDAADGYLVVVSPELARSKVCAVELSHAQERGKRVVPVTVRSTDPSTVPEALSALNWIDATGGVDGPAADRVVDALDTDLDRVRAHTRLLVRASEWEHGSRDASSLLRGRELSEAEAFLAEPSTEPRPTELQTRYVLASRKASARRQRGAIGVVSVLLVAALVLGVLAWGQRNTAVHNQELADRRAAESRSRELAVSALGQLDTDPERGLLLSLAAVRSAPTAEATSALRSALQASHVRATFRGHTGAVMDLAYDDAGNRLLSASGDGTARIWHLDGAVPPTVLSGHTDLVVRADFSPDGSLVATASYDGTARIWDAATGEEVATLHHPGGAVFDVAFSPDGSRVVTAGEDGTARMWAVPSGDLLEVLGGHSRPIYDADFGPSGDLVATASDDDTARIWDVASGQSLEVLHGHLDGLYTIGFDPSGRSVVTSSQDGTARIWDVSTGKATAVLQGHGGPVVDAVFNADGSEVVTASEDSTARIWDASTGASLAVLKGHEDVVDSAAFSPDGRYVVTASDDGTARVWDASSGEALTILRGHTGPVETATFSPDGQEVATGGNDGTVREWAAVSGQVIDHGHVAAVNVDPAGHLVAIIEGNHDVRLVDPASGATVRTLQTDAAQTYAVFNSDGTLIASIGYDGVGHVWDTSTGDEISRLHGHDPGWATVDAFDRQDELLTYGEDGTARLWDARSGQQLRMFRRDGGLWEAHLSADGSKVFTTGITDGGVEMWDAATGTELWHGGGLYGTGGIGAALSPDGRLAFTTTTSRSQVWDAATGRLVATLDDAGTVRGAGFTADSARLVTRCEDGAARIFDARTGRVVVEMRGTTASVNGVYESPDGRWVVTTTDDGRARVFDEVSGALVATLPGGVGAGGFPVMADDDHVVVTPTDGAVRMDRCDACATGRELVSLARSRVTRGLTAAERQGYLGERAAGAPSAPTPVPVALSNEQGSVPDGPLQAGEYTVDGLLPGLRLALQDGWLGQSFVGPDPPAVRVGRLLQLQRLDSFSNGLAIAVLSPARVIDPYKDWNERYNVVPFPSDLAAWFGAHPNVKVTRSGSIVVGGVRGQLVETVDTSTPDTPWPNCGGPCTTVDAFTLQHDTGPITTDDEIGALSPGEVDRWIILDVNGQTVMIDAFSGSRSDFAKFWPVVQKVLDSISFDART
jgi:WD40 repeat protein